MKKKIIVVTFSVLAVFLYIGTKSSKTWQTNQDALIDSPYDLSDSESLALIYKDLKGVDYAAIVYPTGYLEYPNSWLHRVIKKYIDAHGNTSYSMKADVRTTLKGEEYKSIEYGSAGAGLPNYPILVALCEFEGGGLYAPDLGYERPASKQLIEHLESLDKSILEDTANSVCP